MATGAPTESTNKPTGRLSRAYHSAPRSNGKALTRVWSSRPRISSSSPTPSSPEAISASAAISALLRRSSRSLTDEKMAVQPATAQKPAMARVVWVEVGTATLCTPSIEATRVVRAALGMSTKRNVSHRAVRSPARPLASRVTAISWTANRIRNGLFEAARCGGDDGQIEGVERQHDPVDDHAAPQAGPAVGLGRPGHDHEGGAEGADLGNVHPDRTGGEQGPHHHQHHEDDPHQKEEAQTLVQAGELVIGRPGSEGRVRSHSNSTESSP